jgi:FkbM family methyltransferase
LKLQNILNGFVHSIEANPESFEKLTRTTSNNKYIKTYNIGLSEFTGKRLLNISSGASESASSFLSPNDKMSKEVIFENKIEVNCYTLIDFAKMNNISRINFLYLDMQGVEYYVLKGSLDLIKNIDVIYLEVCFVETYEGEVLFDIINNLLSSNGFKLKKIAAPLNAKHGNALYLNNTIK